MGAYMIEEQRKGYLLFTITRNEKRNAINYDVMEGLTELIERSTQPATKAVMITGDGENAFCSGGDLSVFHLLETREKAYAMLSKMAAILYKIALLPVPTLALMNGHAVGGGMELAAACDFRLARKGIKAGFIQGNQAITTGWGGGSILSEKMPAAAALRLLLNADLQSAEQLQAAGFIDELYEGDPLEAGEQFLENILKKETAVLSAYKDIWVRKYRDSRLLERMEEEVQRCSILWESDAHHSYVKQFIEKKNNL